MNTISRVRLIQPMTIKGTMYHPGAVIRIPVSALSKLAGKVEPLDIPPEPEPPPAPPPRPQLPDLPAIGMQADGTCFCCKGRDWWRSKVKMTCRRCHPPAPGAEIITKR